MTVQFSLLQLSELYTNITTVLVYSLLSLLFTFADLLYGGQ